MSNLIFDLNGQRAKRETEYDPRLVAALAILEPLLKEQGLSLYCVRCHAIGQPDGLRGLSAPGAYILECGCSRRTLTARGKATIQ